MRRFTRVFCAALLLLVLPMRLFAQQPRLIKVSEVNISHIATIEERVFLIHAITDKGYFCFKNPELANTVDVYVPSDASDELSDFDFYYDNLLYDQLNEFSLLDKATRGNLFVQWRQGINDDVYKVLYESFTRGLRSDNPTCETALPFCTNNGLYNFPAGVDAGSPCGGTCSEPYHCSGTHQGQDNCLSTAPNPAFYYMRIDEPGNLNIYMYSTPSHDIDFDCWGPFDDIATACDQLSCSNMVDCSYSASSTENCHINNALQGQYYILLITNYSNQTCNINFSNTGTGTTDCSILPPLVDNDGPYCVGETIHLSAIGQPGATYQWTGPNGFTSNLQNPTITNCTMSNMGTYTCTITVGSESNSAQTSLIVLSIPEASFTAPTVCAGNPTEFTSTSTVTGQHLSEYNWDFGDGSTGTGETVSHTYAAAGTYTVTHSVATGGGCSDDVTQTVTVVAAPAASFTATTVCQGEATQFTSTTTGEQITGFSWNFGDGQTGSGETTSHTYATAGTFQVTLTAEGSGGTCAGTSTQSVTVYATPAPVATANPASVQYAEASTITVNPGAEGNFTYHWEPADMVLNPDSQTTQTVELIESQLYTVTVTNTQGGCTTTAYVAVSMDGSNMTATANADQYELCEGSSTTLHVIPIAGTGNYSFSWTPANTLSNPTGMNPVATPGLGTTTYSCHVSDGIVETDVSVDITVYPKKSTDIQQTICEGSTYNFYGQILSQAGVYHHTLYTSHGCDSIINLTLGINDHDESDFNVPEDESCDEYFWDPMGHEIIQSDHDGMVYNMSGTYHRTYKNIKDCDSIVTMRVRFEYTPHPTPIYPMDETNTAPHWVVTATEFQINTYDFHLWDTNPYCYWDTVTWTLEGAPQWITEPFGNRGQCCKVYVLDIVNDTVWLKAHAFNRCAPEGGVMQKYWLVCSFYDVDEQDGIHADFSVMPNPNNGQMRLNFEHLTGKVNIKVYDMRGALIDNFETYNSTASSTLTYDMGRHADGIYHFVVTGKEGTLSKKVIIQR